MNERIQQLAEQAGMTVDSDYSLYTKDFTTYGNFVEKFAQLIVQECFDVVINDGRFHDAKGILKAGKSVAIEHFGVEE